MMARVEGHNQCQVSNLDLYKIISFILKKRFNIGIMNMRIELLVLVFWKTLISKNPLSCLFGRKTNDNELAIL